VAREDCIMRNLIIFTLYQNIIRQIEDEAGRACSKCEKDVKCIYNFHWIT
jgi:hypothetical protein